MRATASTLAAGISIVGLLQALRAPAANGDALGEVIVTATRQIAARTVYAASEERPVQRGGGRCAQRTHIGSLELSAALWTLLLRRGPVPAQRSGRGRCARPRVNPPSGWFGGAHLRYFGATPLTQDDAVRSHASPQVKAEAGYHFSQHSPAPSVSSTCSTDATMTSSPSTPVNDVHSHPMEPRIVRMSLSYRF
jgi:hypothetical protein